MMLITGATGFIGNALLKYSRENNYSARGVDRYYRIVNPSESDFSLGSLCRTPNWDRVFKNIDCVVHCAGLAHQSTLARYFRRRDYLYINRDLPVELMQKCVQYGVRRFVFISTAKVNGESSAYGASFNEENIPSPSGIYAESKYEAELKLIEISMSHPIELVIIRPVLVYGPGMKANFLKLVDWISKGRYFLLADITKNKRSYISIYNLIDFIMICTKHPNAKNQTFLISDDEDKSTFEIINAIAKVLNTKLKIIVIGSTVAKIVFTLLCKRTAYVALHKSFVVDISKSKRLLNWRPIVTFNEGLSNALKISKNAINKKN